MNKKQIEREWQFYIVFLKKWIDIKNISQDYIVKKTGLKQSNLSRLFGLNYCPTLRTIILISKAVGIDIFVHLKSEHPEVFNQAMDELGRRTKNLPKN